MVAASPKPLTGTKLNAGLQPEAADNGSGDPYLIHISILNTISDHIPRGSESSLTCRWVGERI
jgi:hypothetical protein